MAEQSKFKRVVLKLSGEAMAGEKGFGIDPLVVDSIARQIKDVTEAGLEVAVVNGGGRARWKTLACRPVYRPLLKCARLPKLISGAGLSATWKRKG